GAASDPAAGTATAANGAGGEPRGAVTVVVPTRVQGVIARRMTEAQTTIPDFQVRTEADVTALLALRGELRAQTGSAPSVNDFVIRACGLALRAHPEANAAYVDGAWHRYERVNVGMAVAGDGTLVVPTVFDADRRSVTEIARDTRALAEKVREGRIGPAELDGGTFTVSNLGMFGVTSFTAVVNPGQAAILAVGTAVERVTLDEAGAPRARRTMELSLSCDHRILYGADAARLVAAIRERLEAPLGLLA
ncbi:dihydrolipoamide acetyltransferase family protein, partial [Patulibacter sp. S7RM1-6]